jgi:acetoacetate decarboxylase
MTRAYPVGKHASPVIGPGGRFGATCTAGSHEIASAVVTLKQVSPTGPTVNGPPMHNTRHFPAFDRPAPAVFELVESGGRDREITEIWEGEAELRFGAHTIEPLQAIAPREVLKGFRFSFAYTVDGGTVLAQHEKAAAE